MAWVYSRTGKSALICGYLFHGAFNVWPFLLLTNAIPGQELGAFDTRLFVLNAVVVAAAASMLTVATKGRLGFPHLAWQQQIQTEVSGTAVIAECSHLCTGRTMISVTSPAE